jgi:hypothetical protein
MLTNLATLAGLQVDAHQLVRTGTVLCRFQVMDVMNGMDFSARTNCHNLAGNVKSGSGNFEDQMDPESLLGSCTVV